MRPARRHLAVLALVAGLVAGCRQGADAGAHAGAGGGAAADLNGPASGVFQRSEYVMGSPTAKVTAIEYLSDTCTHCARYDAEVFPTIKKDYIDTGKVKYVIREFLTDPVQISAAGFALARCAGRDKYWPVVEGLFRNQEQLFKTGDAKTIFNVGKAAGMSQSQMDSCVRDDKILQGIADRVQKAVDQDHIQGTPTLIVNGVRYENEMDLPATRAALDKALAAAK
jgi:protein-disulfide isomerase